MKPTATPEEVQEVISGEASTPIFAQQLMTSREEARQALEDIQDRHRDIVKLEKSLKVRRHCRVPCAPTTAPS